jgi:ASC-1-like (ASCH) protein
MALILVGVALLVDTVAYAKPPKSPQEFNLTVHQPWLSDIMNGTKSVEGRLNQGIFSQIEPGDFIFWNGLCLVQVTFVDQYPSILQMLVEEGLKRVLPGVNSVEKALAIYNAFYPGRTTNVSAIGIGMALTR